MHRIVLDRPDDAEGWRRAARTVAEAAVDPADVVWQVAGDAPDLLAGDGFADAQQDVTAAPSRSLRVPRRFPELAELVVCHRDDARFSLLYRILCRLQAEPKLLEIASDPDVHAAEAMARSVRRDRHKMTAFVRFRRIERGEGEAPAYLAFFEPDHHILRLAAPFFVERFRTMIWTIVTPEARASWDGQELSFGPGGTRAELPGEDSAEDAWRTYYAHIFNPARLKADAMRREMPVKYWHNLPESRLIAPLIRSAGAIEAAMVDIVQTTVPRRAAVILAQAERPTAAPAGDNGLEVLRREAAGCQRCPLYRDATQTVFGEGLPTADLVFVGEQPGDREDLAGRPFVGPAGALFDRALGEAGIDRKRAYVTNAVKHFKFEPRGKKRIHKKPSIGEIDACHHWLEQELAVLRPRLTVALGATAIRSLTGSSPSVLASRGKVLASPLAGPVFVTVHPSFLLRLPDEAAKAVEYGRFVADLVAIRTLAAGSDAISPTL